MELNSKGFINGVKKSIPILIGYTPVALTFGILCKTSGLSLLHAFLLSFVLYSGAAQFMLVDFLVSGVPVLGVAISIFLLNSRLFLMSASIGATVNQVNHATFPVVGWLLTDESFSILSFNKQNISTKFTLGVQIPPYFVWGIFTIIGYFLGDFLPKSIQVSLGMGLLGLFIALLVPNVKKHKITVKVILATAIIYILIYYMNVFPLGWDIVVSIILSSVIGILILGNYSLED